MYRLRARVEATHGQASCRCGVRQCRYSGSAKARLQHLATAAAVNLVGHGIEFVDGSRRNHGILTFSDWLLHENPEFGNRVYVCLSP